MERGVENALSTTSTKRGFMGISLPSDEELMQMGVAYQEGGEYPLAAQQAEDQYIHDNILRISEETLEENERDYPDYVSLEDNIGIARGSWQCRYGFYRTVEVIRRVELEKIVALVGEVFNSEVCFDTWLLDKNPNLGGSTPQSLIDKGRANKVILYLESLKE